MSRSAQGSRRRRRSPTSSVLPVAPAEMAADVEAGPAENRRSGRRRLERQGLERQVLGRQVGRMVGPHAGAWRARRRRIGSPRIGCGSSCGFFLREHSGGLFVHHCRFAGVLPSKKTSHPIGAADGCGETLKQGKLPCVTNRYCKEFAIGRRRADAGIRWHRLVTCVQHTRSNRSAARSPSAADERCSELSGNDPDKTVRRRFCETRWLVVRDGPEARLVASLSSNPPPGASPSGSACHRHSSRPSRLNQ